MFSVTAARGVRYAHINQSECSAQVVQCGGPDAAYEEELSRCGFKHWTRTVVSETRRSPRSGDLLRLTIPTSCSSGQAGPRPPRAQFPFKEHNYTTALFTAFIGNSLSLTACRRSSASSYGSRLPIPSVR